MLITTDEQMREFVDRASRAPMVAVDTEFVRERHYFPRLCLVQLGTEDEQVAIDPFAVTDTEPLVRLFQDPRVVKVFHACSQDMEVLLRFLGILPRPVFDTQLAASYLGDRCQVGYGHLVGEYCHVKLTKTEAMTDWAARPLDDAQLAYALDDVKYLPSIWRTMTKELEERGRADWVLPEFEHATDPATYLRDPREAFRKVRRVGTLTRRQLATARELAAWREHRAMELDLPRRSVLSDELLIDLARVAPTDMRSLLRIRGTDGFSAEERAQLVAACAQGLACPEDACPEADHHGHLSLDAESVCDLMYALTRLRADQLGVAPSVLASRDDLVAFSERRAGSPLSGGWRYEVIGRHLEDLLEGRSGLTVKDGRVELL